MRFLIISRVSEPTMPQQFEETASDVAARGQGVETDATVLLARKIGFYILDQNSGDQDTLVRRVNSSRAALIERIDPADFDIVVLRADAGDVAKQPKYFEDRAFMEDAHAVGAVVLATARREHEPLLRDLVKGMPFVYAASLPLFDMMWGGVDWQKAAAHRNAVRGKQPPRRPLSLPRWGFGS